MLEDRSCESCLVSRVFASSCQTETNWSCMTFIGKSKRPLEFDSGSDDCRHTKSSKLSDSSQSPEEESEESEEEESYVDENNYLPDYHGSCEIPPEEFNDVYDDDDDGGDNSDDDGGDFEDAKYGDDDEDGGADHLSDTEQSSHEPSSEGSADFTLEQSNNGGDHHPHQQSSDGHRSHAGDSSPETDSLIQHIGRDNSISVIMKCSRSDYGTIASLNKGFRSLIRSGEIYKLRRKKDVVEHWVYFSCNLLQWEAYDPNCDRWMHLPPMPSNGCFIFSDKESLAVGTELLVFGKEVMSHVIYRYSILTNSWTSGMKMNAPRCLFGSASLGEIAILAGGCDPQGNSLSSAEMYNSENQTWVTLPSMTKPRKMCSGVFMDKKFYVIGGIGGSDSSVLYCGEEYDLEAKKWTEFPSMSPAKNATGGENEVPAAAGAPPLVAVVNNELYAADHADMEIKKYDKVRRSWLTIGRLPERAVSLNGWGLAFRACGDRLIVIGGPRALGEGFIELNSWVPSGGPPEWNLLARKQLGNFVYNCAVMGC